MSVSDEKAIITIEVELKSDVTGDVVQEERPDFFGEESDEFNETVRQQVNEIIKEETLQALEDEGVDTDTLNQITKGFKDVDSKGISNVTSMAKNPQGFMENTFLQVLGRAGPHGALAVAIITSIAASPEMVKAVVQALGVKGGPLNQDYAFTEEEQFNLNFSRAVQFKRLTGDDPVITVTTKGFVTGDEDFVDNSLVDTNKARTARVGLRDSSLGLTHGI